jgi:hypothetical protein
MNKGAAYRARPTRERGECDDHGAERDVRT